MSGWYTVEPLAADTWVISEYRHWEEPHCYLLRGRDAAALIDTGLGVAPLLPVVRALIGPLPVTVLTTHVHWDHIGGHGAFSDLAVHEKEAPWLRRFPLPPEAVRAALTAQPCTFPAGFSAEQYRVFQGEPRRLLRDGQVLDIGGRRLTVLHTPGHSPGHCCFLEAERGWLFAGDLLYAGSLDAFYPTTDPVQYRQSVRRVQKLGPVRLLPGHHRLDLPANLASRAAAAFDGLAAAGVLHHGAGRFDFGLFQIHL